MFGAIFSILGFGALCSIPPAVIITFGPKLGLRQMVQTRYSWGYFPVTLVGICAAASSIGYCILDVTLGGDTLSSVTTGRQLTPIVGIVIISVVALVLSFAGIHAIIWIERFVWIPVLISFITLIAMAGTGPDGLHIPPDHSTASGVLNMGSVIAGFYLSYSPGVGDTSHHLRPNTSSWKLFWVTYAGFFLGGVPILMLGAAFSVAAQDIPAWHDALNTSNGALFELIMGDNPEASTATRGWSKFCIVLLALSVIPNITITFYSFGLNLQTIFPLLTPVPRFTWMLFATALTLPLGIIVSLNSAYYSTLSNFTSVLGYWAALYTAPVLLEWFVIRKFFAPRSSTSDDTPHGFDRTAWNDWRRLPLGIGALGAAVCSLGVLIPSISQVWFEGPIAQKGTGDIAFETGFAVTALLYVPLRLLELKFWGY